MSDAPRRIRLSRTKGWRMPPDTLKVDRSTGFGNPFPIRPCTVTCCGAETGHWSVGTFDGPGFWVRPTEADARALSVRAFRTWLTAPSRAHLVARAQHQLRGKNLACWCPLDQPCHADVLLEIANAPLAPAPEALALIEEARAARSAPEQKEPD